MQKKWQKTLTLTRRVAKVGETQSVGAKGFLKRELVLADGTDEYPKGLPIEFTKDETALLDSVNVGDTAEVEFFLEGSAEWNGRYFVRLRGVQVEVKNAVAPTAAAPKAAIGMTAATCFAKWQKVTGKDAAEFGKFCIAQRPDIEAAAKAAGQKFSQFAATRMDVWADLANKMETAGAATGGTDDPNSPDYLPF